MSCSRNLLNEQRPILPFLFETRTLHSRPFRRPQTPSFPKPSRRHFSITKCSPAGLEDRNNDEHEPPEPPPWSYPPDNAQTFHFRPTQSRSFAPPTQSRPSGQAFRFGPNQSDPSPPHFRAPYDSTITSSERAIFDRIFADISSSPAVVGDVEPENDAEPFASLDTIFNDAVDELQKKTEHLERRKVVPTLSFYSVKLKEKADWRQPGKIGSDDVSNLAAAHAQYRHKLEAMLESAQTDVEVWQVLEKEVFSLIHELNTRIKQAEEAEKTPKKKKKKKPRKGAEPETAVTSSPPPPSGEDKNKATQKPATGKTRQPLRPASLPPTVLLSILQTEYPEYLSKTLRILRDSFPTSPFALHLLPTVRRLGPISYVLGASTALYNETMLLMWNHEGNLHAMADLLDEMRKKGVESDPVTLAFLTGLKQIRSFELADHGVKWRRMWWSMGSQVEGWQRIAQGLERCREEVMARQVDKSREAKELDDEEQREN